MKEKLRDKIIHAVSQLDKHEYVLEHLFADLLDNVAVTKVLALPNVSRSLVKSMLDGCPDTAKELCDCFKTTSVDLALKRILCADDLTDLPEPDSLLESELGDADPHPVLDWWANVTSGQGRLEPVLSEDVYEKIVSRLVGPYSKVTVEKRRNAAEARTAADCIHLTGLRFGRQILRPDQLDVLASEEPFVFLTGPPGAGKTLVLGLKAAEWARRGDYVVLVFPQGVVWGSLVSWTLFNQVLSALKNDRSKTQSKGGNTSGKQEKCKPTVTADTEEPPKLDDAKANPETSEKKDDGKVTEKDDPAQNLHYVTISSDSDPEQIVHDLMSQSQGRPVRLIVDECPSKRSPEPLHRMLSNAQKHLQSVKESLREIASSGKRESSRDDGEPGSSLKRTDDERFASVKTSAGKIGHLLKDMQKRLLFFQPPSGRPSVTQSAEWKSYMTAMQEINQDIQLQLQDINVLIVDKEQCSEKITTVLEQCAATTLEADGILYNTETSLGYFVLTDVFQTIQERQSGGANISIWSSGVFPSYRPEGFVQKVMSHCIRCPPTVQRVLQHVQTDITRMLKNQVPDMDHRTYSYQWSSIKETSYPLPTDGPEVQLFDHSGHVTKVKDISDCRECGETLAEYLQRTLHDGYESGLRVEDIVISGNIHVLNDEGCAFIQALRDRGIDVEYESFNLTMPPPYPGKAFIIGGGCLQGLESKLVVYLPEVTRIPESEEDPNQFSPDVPKWVRKLGRWNRCHLWFVASRCLSQLVVFHV